jgi:hypothetical protein
MCDLAFSLLTGFGVCWIFIFPKVKLALKEGRFRDTGVIQSGVTDQLKGLSLRDFQDLWKRSQICVEFGGGCINSL